MKIINFKTALALLVKMFFVASCQDVVEVDLSDEDISLYVVEAKITTTNNPYVMLYKSQLVSSDQDYPGVSAAQVVIAENSAPQRSITLQKSGEMKGLYRPKQGDLFLGKEGHEYTLTITVGDVVMQATDWLAPVEAIDSIQVRPSPRGDSRFLAIYTYGNEPVGLGNYYKWDIYINNKLLYASDNLIVVNDDLVDGSYIEGFEIFTDFHDPDEPDDRILKLGDTIQVRQTSISRFGYEYYSQMVSQGQTGGLFSVPPANIKSNFVSSDGRTVLGMFMASDVSISNSVIIDEQIENGLRE